MTKEEAKHACLGMMKVLHGIGEFDFFNDWNLSWYPEETIDGTQYTSEEGCFEVAPEGGEEPKRYYLSDFPAKADEFPDDLLREKLQELLKSEIQPHIDSMRKEVDWLERFMKGLADGSYIWKDPSTVCPKEEA